VLSKILLVDVHTSAGWYVGPLPHRSIQTRGDDGPARSPDGTRIAFVVASVLWVVQVHPDGTFTGTPRQVTYEVTDAPSWSGDSSQLLYLHNGQLRIVSAAGGPPPCTDASHLDQRRAARPNGDLRGPGLGRRAA
jgi:Tol biopolymer transport system component